MEFYEFCLDDYARPGFSSGRKFYYGTKENFQLVLDNIENVLDNGAEIRIDDMNWELMLPKISASPPS